MKTRDTSLAHSEVPAQFGPRERLLDAAEALVYAGGIHATGVDAIVRASGTARKSFYTYFDSKDALVAAALERRHARWMHWFTEGSARAGDTPRARLLGMFDLLHAWFASPDFHGCAFLNASGEIASSDDPIRQVARAHKADLLHYIVSIAGAWARERGRPQSEASTLARQWLILIDGAIGVALVSGAAEAALDACAAGERLLDQAERAARPRSNRKR